MATDTSGFRGRRQRLQSAINDYSSEAKSLFEKDRALVKNEVAEYQRRRYKEIFKTVVDEFYDSYDPVDGGYQRSYSLYNVFSDDAYNHESGFYDINDTYMELLNKNKMTRGRRGAMIFDTVFGTDEHEGGWHGGAESIGHDADIWGAHPGNGAYWRTVGWVKYPDRDKKVKHRYGKWFGTPAPKLTPSPYKRLEERLDAFEETELMDKSAKIIEKHNKALVPKIGLDLLIKHLKKYNLL